MCKLHGPVVGYIQNSGTSDLWFTYGRPLQEILLYEKQIMMMVKKEKKIKPYIYIFSIIFEFCCHNFVFNRYLKCSDNSVLLSSNIYVQDYVWPQTRFQQKWWDPNDQKLSSLELYHTTFTFWDNVRENFKRFETCIYVCCCCIRCIPTELASYPSNMHYIDSVNISQ